MLLQVRFLVHLFKFHCMTAIMDCYCYLVVPVMPSSHNIIIIASCTPSIKLSTKNLRCFYTTTATKSDGTSVIIIIILLIASYSAHRTFSQGGTIAIGLISFYIYVIVAI